MRHGMSVPTKTGADFSKTGAVALTASHDEAATATWLLDSTQQSGAEAR